MEKKNNDRKCLINIFFKLYEQKILKEECILVCAIFEKRNIEIIYAVEVRASNEIIYISDTQKESYLSSRSYARAAHFDQ